MHGKAEPNAVRREQLKERIDALKAKAAETRAELARQPDKEAK